MSFLKSALVAAVAAATLVVSGVAQARELRMLSGWTPANKGTFLAETIFMKSVEETSAGKIRVRRMGPEAVPPFEQLQPVAAGVFDILFTHGAYHSGTSAIGMTLDGMKGDPELRRKAGIWDAVDRHYQKHGLTTLALLPQGSMGYHMVLRQPIGPDGGFKGRRIRGTVTYHPLIRGLGGSPVVLPGGEVYSALEKGVVDGAAWPTIGVLDLKWHEVAKYLVRPVFGVSTIQVMINSNLWKKLTEEERKLLLEAGRRAEMQVFQQFDAIAIEEEAALVKQGMQITTISKENQERMGTLWAEGLWGLAKKHGAEADAIRKLVEEHNLGL